MSELAVISPLIASLNPSFTSRIQSPSDYNEKIMIDRIKDRIGIDWSATRPQASEDVKQNRGRKAEASPQRFGKRRALKMNKKKLFDEREPVRTIEILSGSMLIMML